MAKAIEELRATETIHPDLEWREKILDKQLNISDRWLWPKTDTGSYGGPFNDWQNHRKYYFEYLPKVEVQGKDGTNWARPCGHTIITAGGNMGAYVRCYAEMFQHVYAFEPSWLSFVCMVANNPRRNVHWMNMALGEESGWCQVDGSNKHNMGTHKVTAMPNAAVPMATIDQFNFSKVDAIQLDVEGYEQKVLLGARETIKLCKPIIIIERAPNNIIKRLFEELGYSIARQSSADFVFVHESKLNI